MPVSRYNLPRPVPQPGRTPRISAAALSYRDGEDNAPKVVAKGQGKVAEQILALAHEHHIPVYDDPLLVKALSTVNLGDEIPPELYQVVAEVIAYIYRVAGKLHP